MSLAEDISTFLDEKDFSLAIFDLDNTLVNLNLDWIPLKSHLSELNEELYGKPRDFSRLAAGLEGVRADYGDEGFKPFSDLIAEWEIVAAKERAVELPDRTKILKNLKEDGKQTAIFTGNCRESAEITLQRFGLLEFVDLIIGREDVPHQKPDPSGLLLILEHFKALASDAIYMGDAEADQEAGDAAGIRTIIVPKE
ncbi:MAG TPA: HAD-IA family hydrolase [Candidatus Lokiarchaeia archaeon]|nr:HAD-IA family hydrolase [Candidatus Lokiarchaeia archaeon]